MEQKVIMFCLNGFAGLKIFYYLFLSFELFSQFKSVEILKESYDPVPF